MDEETRKLLLENMEISRKNLELLQKIEGRMLWQRIWRIVKWTVFVVLIIIGLWQVQPYINILLAGYQNLEEALTEFQNILKNLPR